MITKYRPSDLRTPAALVGLAIGDALGMPFEGLSAEHIALCGWDGTFWAPKNHLQFKAGQYTDDTQMALALARAIVEKKDYDPETVLRHYLDDFLPVARGIGGTVKQALEASKKHRDKTGEIQAFPVAGDDVRGNGVVMRIAPLGILTAVRNIEDTDWALQEANLTHRGPASVSSARNAMAAMRRAHTQSDHKYYTDYLVDPSLPMDDEGTWTRAFMCFLMTDNFASAVQSAVRLGRDTDTVAACTGALAGAWYGIEGIPAIYKDNLEDFAMIRDLERQLYALGTAITDVSSS